MEVASTLRFIPLCYVSSVQITTSNAHHSRKLLVDHQKPQYVWTTTTVTRRLPSRQIYVRSYVRVVKWSEVKWSEVQCMEGGKNEILWGKLIRVIKWWEMKGWGESVSTVCVGKNTGNCIQYFLALVLFTFCTCCILRCLVCIVVVVLCVLLSSYVYCCFYFRCRTAG